MDSSRLPATEIARRIASGDLRCEDYVSALLQRARERNPKVNAFITLREEEALAEAKEVDRKVRRGESLGPLGGLAVAVKDNISTKGLKTTCGSRMLRGYVPPYDATAVERVKAAGGIVVGKTNMDEFAMGSTTANSAFGPVSNPVAEGRSPGGSSGGSAAAVADGMATLALGSDTGGSIRCPASFCSLVGLKPTYGLVSRYGLVEYASSLEQIGPIARDTSGAALLLRAIAGPDSRDTTSAGVDVPDYARAEETPPGKLRLAVARESLGKGTQPGVARAFEDALAKVRERGVSVEEVSVGSLELALAAYYITAMAEASSNLARYDGVRYGSALEKDGSDWNEAYSRTRAEYFGTEVKRRILLGTFALSAGYFEAYYVRAQQVRKSLARRFAALFGKYDMVVGPTMPVLPPPSSERMSAVEEYAMDVNTVPANLVGLPAVTVPCGKVRGLPVGLQLMGPHFSEAALLGTARLVQESTDIG